MILIQARALKLLAVRSQAQENVKPHSSFNCWNLAEFHYSFSSLECFKSSPIPYYLIQNMAYDNVHYYGMVMAKGNGKSSLLSTRSVLIFEGSCPHIKQSQSLSTLQTVPEFIHTAGWWCCCRTCWCWLPAEVPSYKFPCYHIIYQSVRWIFNLFSMPFMW